ncbi:MAG: dodecin domain-containing protein [Proteobacteria bacterium]|nr:dodecin domain-containing protein [Pseudomonadota bacterium]
MKLYVSSSSVGCKISLTSSALYAPVVKQDLTMENGKVTAYRVRLNISFKYRTDTK